MSRTLRKRRPNAPYDKSIKVLRDGQPQYASHSCNHHKGCPYCESNRTHTNKRREPLRDEN